MDNIARLSANDRAELFSTASTKRGDMRPSLIEKDFWVCWTLQRIFTLKDPPAQTPHADHFTHRSEVENE